MTDRKMFVVLPWRVAEALTEFIRSQGGFGLYELQSGKGNTCEEVCNTRTVLVHAEPGSYAESLVNDWLLRNGCGSYHLESWVEPVEWPVENLYLTKAQIEEIIERCRPKPSVDRDTALAILKDFSSRMRTSHDLFGNKILTIRTEEFEAIRAKYLGAEEKEE